MKATILLASMLSAPILAATESPQLFIGVKGGYQWVQDNNYHHSDPKGTILGVYSGLQFSPSWSWDVGYQYHDELKADATSVSVKTGLFESALRYDWYLRDNLSLYGRLGAAYWDMEKTQSSSNKTDAAGFSPLGEVGVNYHFNPKIRLSAGYQYIDSIGQSNTGKYDSYGLLVGLTYTFGRATPSTPFETVSTPTTEVVPATIMEVVTIKPPPPPPPQPQVFSLKTTDGAFDFDSIELSHDFTEQLIDVASMVKVYPQAQAVVIGHTDSTGPASYNQTLSERRAQAVVNRLIEWEVAPTQLEWRGEGESRPIADNNTVEGRAKNRRVEITIPSFQFQE